MPYTYLKSIFPTVNPSTFCTRNFKHVISTRYHKKQYNVLQFLCKFCRILNILLMILRIFYFTMKKLVCHKRAKFNFRQTLMFSCGSSISEIYVTLLNMVNVPRVTIIQNSIWNSLTVCLWTTSENPACKKQSSFHKPIMAQHNHLVLVLLTRRG